MSELISCKESSERAVVATATLLSEENDYFITGSGTQRRISEANSTLIRALSLNQISARKRS
jgi:hypothetical protein